MKINQALVKKVRNGEAVIEHSCKIELKDQLNAVWEAITGKKDKWCADCKYYGIIGTTGFVSDELPDGYEVIPLSKFFETNELSQEDKELIAKIDERLKHYKLITDNEQPITDQKERWSVNVERIADHLNEYKIEVGIYILGDILSKEEAERAAQAIRETLKNL